MKNTPLPDLKECSPLLFDIEQEEYLRRINNKTYENRPRSKRNLSSNEEVELAKCIERASFAIKALASEKPKGTRKILLEEIVDQGKIAKEILITANMGLAHHVAKEYAGGNIAIEDLCQVGSFGLIRAAEKFEWRKGCRFSTYAVCWIRYFIELELGEQGYLFRLPYHAHRDTRKIRREKNRLKKEYKRDPTLREISQAANVPLDRTEFLLMNSEPTLSLDNPFPSNNGNDLELAEAIEDTDQEPIDHAAGKHLAVSALYKHLDDLTLDEKSVISRRFGLNGRGAETQKEISDAMGVSLGTVVKIERSAMFKLRNPEITSKLRGYHY